MRFRAGLYGTVNAVLGAVFLPVFAALLVVCGVEIARGDDLGWSCVALVASLLGCVVMAGVLLSGVSTWRPVTLTPGGLSVPGFNLRRGLYRDVVPMADIVGVDLRYRSEPRNGRWQLVVTRPGGALACDSITSNRGSSATIDGTPAWHTVERLRAAIDDARHNA